LSYKFIKIIFVVDFDASHVCVGMPAFNKKEIKLMKNGYFGRKAGFYDNMKTLSYGYQSFFC